MILALVVFPVAVIGAYSFWEVNMRGVVTNYFTLNSWADLFTDTYYFYMLLRTLQMSLIVTIIAMIVGYIPAYFLTMVSPSARGFLVLLLFLPSWISYVVRTMSWVPVLGRNGVVNGFLLEYGLIDQPLMLLYNDVAVYIGLVHFVLPIMILNIFIGLQAIDRNVLSAARTLGATGFYAFRTVTFPLALPGLAAGCLLCFILSTGAYITPMILGGPGSKFYASMLYDTIIVQLDWSIGAMLALVLTVMLIAVIYIYSRFIGLSSVLKAMRS